jgi:hypothetical protein
MGRNCSLHLCSFALQRIPLLQRHEISGIDRDLLGREGEVVALGGDGVGDDSLAQTMLHTAYVEHTQIMDLPPFVGYFRPQGKNNLQKKKSTIRRFENHE